MHVHICTHTAMHARIQYTHTTHIHMHIHYTCTHMCPTYMHAYPYTHAHTMYTHITHACTYTGCMYTDMHTRAQSHTRIYYTFTHSYTMHAHAYTHTRVSSLSWPAVLLRASWPVSFLWIDLCGSFPRLRARDKARACHMGFMSLRRGHTHSCFLSSLGASQSPRPAFWASRATYRGAWGSWVACLTLRASWTLGRKKNQPLVTEV